MMAEYFLIYLCHTVQEQRKHFDQVDLEDTDVDDRQLIDQPIMSINLATSSGLATDCYSADLLVKTTLFQEYSNQMPFHLEIP